MHFPAIATSLAVTLLLLASANAAETTVSVLPKTPVISEAFVVMSDAEVDKEATWQAFHNGKKLDPKKFEAQGNWLKVNAAEAGSYTFVLKTKESEFAKTIDLQAVTKKPNVPPKNQAKSPPATAAKAATPTTTDAPAVQSPTSNNPSSANTNPNRSPVQLAAYSLARHMLVQYPNDQGQSTGNQSWSHRMLAHEFEQVARNAIQNKWSTSKIAQEATAVIDRSAPGQLASLRKEKIETLLKEVSLKFGDKGVEESPTDAIMALVSLATILRDNPHPLELEEERAVQQPEPLRQADASTIAAPCCQTTRFGRRR